MKKILMTIALAFALTLPMSTAQVKAEPWYMVTNWSGAEIRSEAYGNGRVKCTISRSRFVHRNAGENWSRWIRVRWKKYGADWNAKDINGKYCPDWNRWGWVDKRDLVSLSNPPF